MKRTKYLILATFAGFCLLRSTQAANLYRLTDLGVVPGYNGSHAEDINDNGHVVGRLFGSDHLGAFHWSEENGMQDLGTLPGYEQSQRTAVAINNHDQVVGGVGDLGAGRPWLWTNDSGMTDLGDPPGGLGSAGAVDINDSGQILLGLSAATGVRSYLRTSAIDWADLGDFVARSLNDSGQVVGSSRTATGEEHAVLWTSEGGIQDLGTIPGHDFSQAYDINNSGQVVGWSGVSGAAGVTDFRAFLWTSGGGMQDLGILPGGRGSGAVAISDGGQVLVARANAIGSTPHTSYFLWTTEDGMQDINSSLDASATGWTFNSMTAMNNAGQIVGEGFNPDGRQRAFLLTPVPEPASTVLLATAATGCGLFIMGSRRHRRPRCLAQGAGDDRHAI